MNNKIGNMVRYFVKVFVIMFVMSFIIVILGKWLTLSNSDFSLEIMLWAMKLSFILGLWGAFCLWLLYFLRYRNYRDR